MRQASEERNSLTRIVHFAAYHKKTKFRTQVSVAVYRSKSLLYNPTWFSPHLTHKEK